MGALVALLVGLTLFAGPIYDAGAAAADQLFFSQGYIEAVLAPHGEG
jgi:multicomponent Na+:H+ antiporter subunit D